MVTDSFRIQDTMLDVIGRGIDRFVGMFSPANEVSRIRARYQALAMRRYAAAQTTRLTGNWSPAGQDVNSLIRQDAPIIRNRIRQLVRDFPYFQRAVNILVNFTVADGIRLQSKVKNEDGQGLRKDICRQIEDAWQWWCEKPDVANRLCFQEFEQLTKRMDLIDGEFLLVKKISKERGRYLPFSLQIYESEWLSSDYAKASSGNEVDQGLEYDPQTGRVVAYHFTTPGGYSLNMKSSGKTFRIPAENVIHGYKTLRPGQLRGISPFTAGVLLAHDLEDYMGAEIDGAKMAAKYLAFINTNDPGGFQGTRTTSTETDTGRKVETIGNCVNEYLRHGETVTLANHNRPGVTFEPFVMFILHMLAVSTDTTYDLLTNDYSSHNYSSLRISRADFRRMMMPIQSQQIRQFNMLCFREFLDTAVMTGKLYLRSYWNDPRYYQRCLWMPAGMESIDPLKESKANIDQITSQLRSPQEACAERGRDYEEVLDECAEAERMRKERGLTMGKVSTGIQENPAKILEEDEADEK